ncbi:LacI family DNA-binding transcriptional regulator [Microbispora triticiradicis]|uniref:LacI family transcriptional regulator n=2 Tax=Microbispora TaxID=2005 RepID=A0ABY3LTX5_9ACTN|nr:MULTISPECIES: LacI family DNA-binding transcriptional regulator [Microbispora]TLP52159.1 LacI family transcriptional regulator [Microbispora fusca]TYB54434.1 LacI family transcriptional regulator [Microbispora tritici]
MGAKRGAVTLEDVARRAGVSLATASRAINGSARKVRPEIRERVEQAARDLDYAANAQAQAVARGRTDVVGLVVQDIEDPYFSSIAAGAMRVAEANGLMVCIASAGRRPDKEIEYVAALRRMRAAAIVIAGSRTDDRDALARLGAEVDAFERSGGRAVLIGQRRLPVDTLVVANRSGARDLATRLTGLGYRSFGVLAGPRGLLTAVDRLAGFAEGLRKAGVALSRDAVVHGEFTRDGGHAAMLELLARGRSVECVFAVNDVMAVGAIAALRTLGLERTVAVAGFDDITTLRDVIPALTTVRLPLVEIGETALEMVLREPSGRPRYQRIVGEVVLRESTPGVRPAHPAPVGAAEPLPTGPASST